MIHGSTRKQAFTFVEILGVIVILGLLWILIVPKVDMMSIKTRQAAMQLRFREFQTAAEVTLKEGAGFEKYSNEQGFVDTLNLTLDPENEFEACDGQTKYFKCKSNDPWNKKYILRIDLQGNEGKCTFISFGREGINAYAYGFEDLSSETSSEYAVQLEYRDGLVIVHSWGFTENIE